MIKHYLVKGSIKAAGVYRILTKNMAAKGKILNPTILYKLSLVD